MSGSKSEHRHLPQFYLEYFASGGRLSVWDKQTDRIASQQKPADIARSKGFYAFDNKENELSMSGEAIINDLDKKAQAIIEELGSSEVEDTSDYKEILANFMAAQHTNSAYSMDIMESIYANWQSGSRLDEEAALLEVVENRI